MRGTVLSSKDGAVARAHGGDLVVSSSPGGEGSEFIVTLPSYS